MNYLDDVVLPVWRFIFNNAALLVVVLSVLAGLCVGLVYRAEDDTTWDKYGIPAFIAVMCGLFLPVIIGLGGSASSRIYIPCHNCGHRLGDVSSG